MCTVSKRKPGLRVVVTLILAGSRSSCEGPFQKLIFLAIPVCLLSMDLPRAGRPAYASSLALCLSSVNFWHTSYPILKIVLAS